MASRDILFQSLISDGYLKTPRLIVAFRAIDRADFVLPEYQLEAYGNYPLPIGEGQTISQPLTVAFMLELLDPRPGEKILDIGAGSGWQTALLAHAVRQNESGSMNHGSGSVAAVERIPVLCEFAKKNLEKYDLITSGIVKWYCYDATSELPDGPYNKIIAAAAASKDIPALWRKILKIGGRIVAPVGGSIWLFIKRSEDEWEEREFPGFAFVPLVSDKRQVTGDKKKDTEYKKLKLRNDRLNVKEVGLPTRKSDFPKLFVFVACLMFPVSFVSFFAYEIYLPHAQFEGTKTVVIDRGLGSRKIAAFLKKEGVISSKWVLVAYVSLMGRASSLKPGEYTFDNVTIPEIVRMLVRGSMNEKIIVIPEGWGARDIADYCEAQKLFPREEFMRTVNLTAKNGSSPLPYADFEQQFDFLKDKPKGQGLEGYLFPDTYRIHRDASPEEITATMLENFDMKLTAELRQEIARQEKTIFEIITMASLIEKEVTSDEDRAVVSGILWKRFEAGMPLQVDATITYVKRQETRDKRQVSNGKVSFRDTKIDSPYNTYRYRGLPKGPIANPGLSAIRAALFPKKSPYLYYLSSPDGRTIFSKTLEEHNQAKAKYLR